MKRVHGPILVANQKVEVVHNQSWLEAIHRSNVARRTMAPNSFFNKLFLEKDDNGKLKSLPSKILKVRPWYTGTVGVIGAKGRAFGPSVESQCEYAGGMKTIITKFDAEQASFVDVMLLRNHGFAPDGTPYILLSNAKTGRLIRDEEEMRETSEVLLSLNGLIRTCNLRTRLGDWFESFNDELTSSWISDSPTIGLLERDHLEPYIRRNIVLDVMRFHRLGILWDVIDTDSSIPSEKSAAQD
ncbi:MAG: hypothetical protein Q7S22_04365 [Candidatus Micrarchaeota archaeon]|nr:hypothetical protein [Candidatus Micrarchaeota archaeon]